MDAKARCCTAADAVPHAQVLVLEKGRYTKAADLSLMEREAMDTMYEAGSLMTTQDASAQPAVCSTATCVVLLYYCHVY